MYFFRGGQIVKKGTYWESEKNVKIVLERDGVLPGQDKLVYFKLPECYLLIPVLLFGIFLSMALPYGIGVLMFFLLCLIHKVLFSFLDECEVQLGKVFSYFSTVYKPHKSFFIGSSRRLKGLKKTEKNENGNPDIKDDKK